MQQYRSQAPITCSWEPIAAEAEASLIVQQRAAQSAQQFLRLTEPELQGFIRTAQAFRPPAVLHPSVMGAYAQTLQSAANAVSSVASASHAELEAIRQSVFNRTKDITNVSST